MNNVWEEIDQNTYVYYGYQSLQIHMTASILSSKYFVFILKAFHLFWNSFINYSQVLSCIV